jgi:predicted molibdopterin-dependent oxidoreductase YjgC
VKIEVDGRIVEAYEGEPIAAALTAAGIHFFRRTPRTNEPRGLYCAIGLCTDCIMNVDGKPNVRTCVTPVKPGMKIRTSLGQSEESWKLT